MRPLDFIDRAAEAYAGRLTLAIGEREYTYREVQAITHRLAHAMRALGFRDEDRVAVYSWSDSRVLLVMLAVMRAGGVLVPVNPGAAPESVMRFLGAVQPRWLFHHERLDDAAASIRLTLPGLRTVSLATEAGPSPSLRTLLAEGGTDPAPDWGDASGNPDRPVTIAQTGGTTGAAKGVTIRTAAYTSYIEAYRRFLGSDDRDPVCLTASQLTPASLGMSVVMFSLGARQIVMPTFNATSVLRTIEEHVVTHLWLPPTAVTALVNHPRVRDYDFRSLRALITGGAAISPDQLTRAVDVFGPCVNHSYGQMETGTLAWLDAGTIARALAGEHPERLASCGRINEAMCVAIMDDSGVLLPSGQAGEIVARGRGVCDYCDDPTTTGVVRTNGWHRTGDLGYLDEERYLFIVGRRKDLIITGGYNVYPAEVEAAILRIPEVQECAVVGVRDELLGEIVTAVVVPGSQTALTGQHVIAHCRDRLGPVRSPKRVAFWAALPKTAAGKIDKLAIRLTITDRHVAIGAPEAR